MKALEHVELEECSVFDRRDGEGQCGGGVLEFVLVEYC